MQSLRVFSIEKLVEKRYDPEKHVSLYNLVLLKKV